MQCDPREVKVYDSLYASQDEETHEAVKHMFSDTSIQVTTVNAPKQKGGMDCGVFAIAASTCLAFGGDPPTIVIHQASVRDHLLQYFEEKVLTQFWYM